MGALIEGKEEVKAITMNAASLLESFPKTKTKRFKVTMPSSRVVSQYKYQNCVKHPKHSHR